MQAKQTKSGLSPQKKEYEYELEEYVQYRFFKVIGVSITWLCRLACFAIAFAVWVGGLYFNYKDSDTYTYLGFIEMWGITMAMVHFLNLVLISSAYKKARNGGMPFRKQTLLTIVEYWSFATVCAAVTAMAFYYAYQEGKLDEYGFADPSLGGGSDRTDGEDEATPAPAPTPAGAEGDEAAADGACAHCVFGYDLGIWQEMVSIGNHTYVPCLVILEFLLNRVPVTLYHFASIVVVVGGYCGANYYIVKNVNDGEPLWPDVLTWSGEDGDETYNQIGFIAGLFVGVGVFQYCLRRWIMARIISPEEDAIKDKKEARNSSKDSKRERRGSRGSRRDRDDDSSDSEDSDYDEDRRQRGKGKGRGRGKGKGKGRGSRNDDDYYNDRV